MNPIVTKLCEWLDATTTYAEPKENLTLKPNHTKPPKWRRFYHYGPVLVEEASVLATDAAPVYKHAVKHVSYNQGVQPGDIITSGNGRRYMVRLDGSLRRV